MIYLDNNAMTLCDPEVAERLQKTLINNNLANPSSNHIFGWKASEVYECAKEAIAEVYNALPSDIVFTSGATEANNHAIIGIVQAAIQHNIPRRKILISAIEHKCVLNAVSFAREFYKYEVEVIPVTEEGRVDIAALKELLNNEVLLVSVMAVNNEIGVVQPYSEIGELCRAVGAIFHVDAAQSAYEKVDMIASSIDMLSLSGGKLYGPAGVGVLIIDSMLDLKPMPLLHGGLQQAGMRSGTIPVYLCDAMSFAIKKMSELRETEAANLISLRKLLLDTLKAYEIEFFVNGSVEHRHPGNLNISLIGYANDVIVQRLQPDFAVSTGAACNAGMIQQSYVLKALGLSSERINSAIRIGLGRFNTENDVLRFAERLKTLLPSLEQ